MEKKFALFQSETLLSFYVRHFQIRIKWDRTVVSVISAGDLVRWLLYEPSALIFKNCAFTPRPVPHTIVTINRDLLLEIAWTHSSLTQTPCFFYELVAQCLNVIFVFFVLRSTSSSTPVWFGWTPCVLQRKLICTLFTIVSPSSDYVLPCEDVWTSSGLAPRIRNLALHRGEWSASRFRRFNLGEMARLYAFHRKLGSPLWRSNETERWCIWLWMYNSSLRTALGNATSRTPCCYGNWSGRREVGRRRWLTLFALKIHHVKSSTRPRTFVYSVMRRSFHKGEEVLD